MQVGSTVPRAERFGPAIPSVEGRKDHVLLCSSLFQHKGELSGEIFWNSPQAQMLPFAEFLSSCWCKLISNKIHEGPLCQMGLKQACGEGDVGPECPQLLASGKTR